MSKVKAPESNSHNLRLEWRSADELAENPANWRSHPPAQVKALKGVLADVGWAGALLYNSQTNRLIDGHLRKEVFKGQQVPVLVGSWTEAQEREILATYDPLSAMAQPDTDALIALLAQVETGSEDVKALLEALANSERLPLSEPDIESFGKWRKLGKEHQNVLVFLKGDIKAIPDVLGEVQIPEGLDWGAPVSPDFHEAELATGGD